MGPERQSSELPLAAAWRPRLPMSCQGPQSKASMPRRWRSSERSRVSASLTASLARAGYSSPVEIRCYLHGEPGGSTGLGGIEAHSGTLEPASSRVTAHFVLAVQPGVRGRDRICLGICLIVAEPVPFCLTVCVVGRPAEPSQNWVTLAKNPVQDWVLRERRGCPCAEGQIDCYGTT